jgi:gas vesicle protein GvpL/GvpF
VSTNSESVVYIYALMQSSPMDLDEMPAVGDADRVRMVSHGHLAALVSDVSLAAVQLPEEALTEHGRLAQLATDHDSVVRAALVRTPVLPLRLATVVANDGAVVRILDEYAATALPRLHELSGHLEWGVRLRTEHREPKTSARLGVSGQSGTDYLASRRNALQAAKGQRNRDSALAYAVHETLAQHATESTLLAGKGQDQLLRSAYLVASESEAAFLAEVDGEAASVGDDGLNLELSGPWPPYSFARLDTHATVMADA